MANGNSTFVEGLACGKPILISNTGNNFLDVEYSNIGMKLGMLDTNDWVKKIHYLEANPGHVDEMSKNSYELAKSQHNYALFSKNIASNLRSLVEK